MESKKRQANNRTEEQIRISPELKDELMMAIIKYNRKFKDRMTIKRFSELAVRKYLDEVVLPELQ